MIDLMFRAADRAAWQSFAAMAALTLATPEATIPAPGISIDEIGIIGDDARHHVNVRLASDTPPMIAGPGVEWIDPATVASPARVFAGGMNYWLP